MRKLGPFIGLVLLAGVCAGCLPEIDTTPSKTAPETAPAPATQSPVVHSPVVGMPAGLAGPNDMLTQTPQQAVMPPTLNPPSNAPPAPAQPPAGAVKADVGVGAQGRSLDNESGAIVTPAKVFFNVRERIVFQDAIPHAINLFEASEGRKLKSHDEFMSRIIQANNIQLPRLPQDRQYFYDPQQGELLVVRQQPK